jgi:hypothetical protein
MRILLGTLEFGAVGGAATYTLTVAGELQLLGHEVTVFANETGEMASSAEERGIQVAAGEHALPGDCDVIYAQDRASAYLLADRYPGRRQTLCMHCGSSELDRWQPPQLPGIVGAVVVLHDRLAQRAASFAHREEVVRLRQPVDLARFAPRSEIGRSPRRALLLGNNLRGARRESVISACHAAGLECIERGRQGSQTTMTPERDINQADIVIGSGRSIVEAMACGRAAFVYDWLGGDGWVTPDTYEAIEAVNFANSTGNGTMVTAASLADRLRGYRQSMGADNLDLARAHHSASRHAEELVGLFDRLAPTEPPLNVPLREFARMSRVQWQTESRALGVTQEARVLSLRAQSAEAALDELRSARWYRILRAVARPLTAFRRPSSNGRRPSEQSAQRARRQ